MSINVNVNFNSSKVHMRMGLLGFAMVLRMVVLNMIMLVIANIVIPEPSLL